MQFALAVTVVLLAILNPVPAADASVSDCKHPAAVEKFAASIYAAWIVVSNPEILISFKIGGGEAGLLVYNYTKQILEDNRQCNAEEVAFIAGQAFAKAGRLTLPIFFKNEAYAIGYALFKFGVLNCQNAISLSLEFFGYVQLYKKGNESYFITYVSSIGLGYQGLLRAHNLNIGEVSAEGAKFIYQSYSEDNQTKCKFTTEDDASPGAGSGP